MADHESELMAFVRAYEAANNSHDVERVAPLILADATYLFTDGSYHGIEEIKAALRRTFATIQAEVYQIHDLAWVAITDQLAVCTYRFAWEGLIRGEPAAGTGRGTNVLVRDDGAWKMLYEHLSS